MLSGGESDFPRSAAGVVALYSAGIYEGVEIDKGLDYLERHGPRRRMPILETHFFYGHYYAIQAMWHAGNEHWQQWYPKIRDLLSLENEAVLVLDKRVEDPVELYVGDKLILIYAYNVANRSQCDGCEVIA